MARADAILRIGAENRTGKAFKEVEGGLSGLQNKVAAVSGALAALGITRLVADSIRAADEINKLSDRLGASTEALSEYQFVAQQTGVSFQTFTTAIQRFGRRLADAANGTGPAVDAFKELGLSAEQLSELPLDQAFEIYGEAISRVENPTKRLALNFKVLDTEGAAALQTFKNGAAGVRELRTQAQQLGLTLDQNTADAASEARDAFGRLQAASRGLGFVLARELAPAVEFLADKSIELLPATTDLIAEGILKLSEFALEAQEGIAEFFDWEEEAEAARNNLETIRIALEELQEAADNRVAPQIGGPLPDFGDFIGAPSSQTDDGDAQREAELEKIREYKEKQLDIEREAAQARLQILQESYFSEFEQAAAKREEELEILEEARANSLVSLEEYKQLELEIWQRYEDEKKRILEASLTEQERFERGSYQERASFIFGTLADITSGVARHNRALFEINKVAAIANAIISTQQGAAEALKWGWPLGPIFAGIIAASGAARVAAIASTSYGGGSPATLTASSGVPPSSVGSGATDQVETVSAPRPINITVEKGVYDDNAIVALIDRINEVAADGVTVNAVAV